MYILPNLNYHLSDKVISNKISDFHDLFVNFLRIPRIFWEIFCLVFTFCTSYCVNEICMHLCCLCMSVYTCKVHVRMDIMNVSKAEHTVWRYTHVRVRRMAHARMKCRNARKHVNVFYFIRLSNCYRPMGYRMRKMFRLSTFGLGTPHTLWW